MGEEFMLEVVFEMVVASGLWELEIEVEFLVDSVDFAVVVVGNVEGTKDWRDSLVEMLCV